MFDRPEDWQVLLLLAPIALAMHWIRLRESRAGSTPYEELTPAQKAWLILLCLPPGAAARLMAEMEEGELRAYVRAGCRIRGSGQLLMPKVLREFARLLPPAWTRGVRRDTEDLIGAFGRRAGEDPRCFLSVLREHWPAGGKRRAEPAKPCAPSETAAEV